MAYIRCRDCRRTTWATAARSTLCFQCNQKKQEHRLKHGGHAQVNNRPLPGYGNDRPQGLGTVVRTQRKLGQKAVAPGD